MLEFKDFYIGCWYYNNKTKNNFQWDVESWNSLSKNEFSYSDIQGIKITKDILLNSGFKYESRKDGPEIELDEDGPEFLGTGNTINFYYYNWLALSMTLSDSWYASYIVNMIYGDNPGVNIPLYFTYIHEIQHFYQFKTNKELKIKIC